MGIDFTDDVLPSGKPVENEFSAVVKDLADNRDKVKSYVIRKTGDDAIAQLAIDKRRMADAGNALNPQVTIRTSSEMTPDNKGLKVYMRAVNKIKRKKGNGTTDDSND